MDGETVRVFQWVLRGRKRSTGTAGSDTAAATSLAEQPVSPARSEVRKLLVGPARAATSLLGVRQEHHVVFTITEDTLALYLDGELISTRDGVDGGMSGNAEDLVLGASTVSRWEDNDNLKDFFDGTISDLAVFNRALQPVEVLLLNEEESGRLRGCMRLG